jgi:hypothetical protein
LPLKINAVDIDAEPRHTRGGGPVVDWNLKSTLDGLYVAGEQLFSPAITASPLQPEDMPDARQPIIQRSPASHITTSNAAMAQIRFFNLPRNSVDSF